jgi:4-hydroxybenzoate polyprenyltransferase
MGHLGRTLRGLALSCHPLPTLAVTGMSAGLAALADNHLGPAVLLVLAVFSGQLSIGWSNDWLDSARDRANARSDKPAALGTVAPSTVAVAGWVALTVTVAASIALGPKPGAAAVVVVVGGWAYNLGLKATAWSWTPYAIAFGSLPAAAALNGPGQPWPAWWAIATGATLGVAAHLANVLPDLAEDLRTGVRGLPHRIGQRPTAVTGPVLMVAATALVVFGPHRHVSWYGWAAVAVSIAVGSVAAVTGARTPGSRRYFLATVAVAVLDLVLFGASGNRLS